MAEEEGGAVGPEDGLAERSHPLRAGAPYRKVSSKGEPDFAYYRAARTRRSWSLGDLRAESVRCANGQATGAEPVPYKSREVRDEQARRIRKAENLTEDDKAMLLAHVARTPYMEVTKRGSG